MKQVLFLLLFFLTLSNVAFSQDSIVPKPINKYIFSLTETATYKMYYKVIGIYLGVGEVIFTTRLDTINGKSCYHFIANGRTNSFYDNFFKVRDRYESWVDIVTLQPVKFYRYIQEGSFRKEETFVFDGEKHKVKTSKGEYTIPHSTWDVVSIIYSMRLKQWEQAQLNDTLHLNLFIDENLYNVRLQYKGKTLTKANGYKYNTFILQPSLIMGSVFKGNEEMNIYVMDYTKVPVKIETPISIGKILAELQVYRF